MLTHSSGYFASFSVRCGCAAAAAAGTQIVRLFLRYFPLFSTVKSWRMMCVFGENGLIFSFELSSSILC